VTTSANPQANTLFFRQIHPCHFKDQTLQSRDFKGKNDPEKLTLGGTVDTTYFAISVDIEDPQNSARQSYDRYLRQRRRTTGVVGLTMSEITSLGLTLTARPTLENDFHWHVVFPEGKNNRGTQGKLLGFASTRGWLYAPANVHPIKPVTKPAN
jgi:hypothetical protein